MARASALVEAQNTLTQPIAPWLQDLWNGLPFTDFPHAVLIYGQAGIGKYDFAVKLAASLACNVRLADGLLQATIQTLLHLCLKFSVNIYPKCL